ncbi:hypothetical protein [Staphylococcus epidermidis]|nr:hypothetical protein [Staphylococcus epidermidis]
MGWCWVIGQRLLAEVLSVYNWEFGNVEIQVEVGCTEEIKGDDRV